MAVGDAEFQKKAIGKMQDVSKGQGRTVLFVSHNMTAVRNLCQKGVVLRDGMTDFMGTADEAINHYLNTTSAQTENHKLMTDCIRYSKSYLKISEIQINNTPYNTTSLTPGQEVLDLIIKGHTTEPMKCEVQLVIRKPDGTALASFAEGRYKAHLCAIQPGDFSIERHIRLPKYMADGDYLIDLYLHEPNVQDYIAAPNIQALHIEGFHDQFARNLRLNSDGFFGLESVSPFND